MRHESSFLNACDKIEAIVEATSEELFLNEKILPAAVLHHLTVVGDAISRLSIELRHCHPEVPWRKIIATLWPSTTFPNFADGFSIFSQRIFLALETPKVAPG